MRRLQTVGLAATLALVLALLASAVAGLFPRQVAPAEVNAPADAPLAGERPRVEVLNGAGVPGLARDVTRLLRQRGFDVVYFGNAPGGPRDTSVVIDRAGRPDEAHRVAAALGIEEVRSAPDTLLYLEATVIVGRDWAAERAQPGVR